MGRSPLAARRFRLARPTQTQAAKIPIAPSHTCGRTFKSKNSQPHSAAHGNVQLEDAGAFW